MSGHSALPPGAVLGESAEPPWAGLAGGLPGSPGEAANPFSFKAFVRSQEQKAATASSHGGSETSSPEGPLRSCFLLEDSAFLAASLGLNKDWREPFFEDPTALDSLLQDDEDDWSGSYRPSAVEEAHLARTPSASLSNSPLNSSCNLSDLQSCSPEQLGRNDHISCSCLGKGEQSSPSDGTSPADGFCRLLQLRYQENKAPGKDFGEEPTERGEGGSRIGGYGAASGREPPVNDETGRESRKQRAQAEAGERTASGTERGLAPV